VLQLTKDLSALSIPYVLLDCQSEDLVPEDLVTTFMGVQFKRIMTSSFIDAVKNLGKTKAAGVNSGDLLNIVAAHTGQSSQLFAEAHGRNARFLQQLRIK
jgi:hypothetical protein